MPAAVLRSWANRSQHVILAGDFYARPDLATMDSIYALNDAGSYTRTGWLIEMEQFDSSHFDANPYCTVGGYVAPLNGSDHKPLRSTVSYSLPAA